MGSGALPNLDTFGADVWLLAADELESLPPPCPMAEVVPGCSGLATIYISHDRLYEQIEVSQ